MGKFLAISLGCSVGGKVGTSVGMVDGALVCELEGELDGLCIGASELSQVSQVASYHVRICAR